MASVSCLIAEAPRKKELPKFQSISVLCSSRVRCNARCAFCIARSDSTEKKSGKAQPLNLDQLRLGLEFARRANTPKAIITSKADPLQEDPDYILALIRLCRNHLPAVDLHTNGLGFMLHNISRKHEVRKMRKAGLTMLTFSLASFNEEENNALMGCPIRSATEHIRRARNAGLWVRCSLVVNKSGVSSYHDVLEYIAAAKTHGAHAVIIREVWIPSGNNQTAEWARQNYLSIQPIQRSFDEASAEKRDGVSTVEGVWGIPTFHVNGLDVTFARCEETNPSQITRTLVHDSNGHGYTNWNKNEPTQY